MITIEYKQDKSQAGIVKKVIVSWNGDKDVAGASDIVVAIKEASVFLDLSKAASEISNFVKAYKIERLVLVIPNTLVSSVHLEHVLANLLNALFPTTFHANITVNVTHPGNRVARVAAAVTLMDRVQKAREVAMIPANIATPDYMTAFVQKLFKKETGITIKVIRGEDIKKKGFGLLYSVGASAQAPPALVVIERKPKKVHRGQKTICILGKGITFDSGGLAIKNENGMVDMKYDKIGAVYAMYATLELIQSDEKHRFVTILPFAENAVSENSTRPGDVFKSYLGPTVEVTNPDAEGRLVLADALGLAHKYKPDLIIDIATLTGQASHINCWSKGYYYAQPLALRDDVERICETIGERMIPMPAWPEYREVLMSPVADLVNSPMKCSDSFVAALFLKEFVPKGCPWLHIDLAHDVEHHIATGIGLRTVVAVVRNAIG